MNAAPIRASVTADIGFGSVNASIDQALVPMNANAAPFHHRPLADEGRYWIAGTLYPKHLAMNASIRALRETSPPMRLRAPARANPLRYPPDPPSGNLGIAECRLRHHLLTEVALANAIDKPLVTSVKVRLIDGPVRKLRYLLRLPGGNATPEVCEIAILVVHSLASCDVWTLQEDSQTAGKWFGVIDWITEAVPNDIGNAALAPKPHGNGAFKSSRLYGDIPVPPFHFAGNPADMRV